MFVMRPSIAGPPGIPGSASCENHWNLGHGPVGQRGAPRGPAKWTGIHRWTVVPAPGAVRSRAYPPCAAAIACTIDRPRPLPVLRPAPVPAPALALAADGSSGPPPRAPRWHRSNARAASWGDMPGPASEPSREDPPPG